MPSTSFGTNLRQLTLAVLACTVAATCLTLPALAMAAPPAKAFGELPVGYHAAISPDGSQIAIISNLKGTYGVRTQPLKSTDSRPWFLTLDKTIKPLYVKWINNRRFVVGVAKSEKTNNTPYTTTFLYTGDIESRKGRIVAKPKDFFRQFNDRVVDWLEDDPDHILMAYSDKANDPYPDIKKVEVATGKARTVKRGQPGIERWVVDEDGTPRIGTGQTQKGNERRIIYNSKSDKWESSDKYPGIEPDTLVLAVTKKGAELVIGDYQGKDTLGLYVYSLAEKKVTRSLYHNDQYDVSGVVMSNDGETIIGAKYTANEDKTELLSEHGTLLNNLSAKFKDYNVQYIDQTADGNTLLVKISAPYDPGGLYMYKAGDEFPTLVSKMYNGFTDADTGDVVAVKYPTRDKQQIPAFITLPPGIKSPKNLPFIVLPHGGPYARDSTRFDYLAQFFATRGYGVLQMNFRGSEGYGKAFKEAGRNNWVVMQQDVEDGTRWLYEKGFADASRTCIAGWSFGGYAALMGVSTDPDLYQCAIAMAALTDINDARRDLRKYRGGQYAVNKVFGEAMKDKAVRKANSPVHVAHNIKVPVFLAHGDLDENVQFDQFTRMKKALKKAKVTATYMKFNNEDHFLSQQENREKFFIGMEKFLTKVNGKSEYMRP